MSQPDPSARPSQVTVAGWAVAAASVVLLFAVFDTMGQLESVDMRERLGRAISSGAAEDLGLTVDDLVTVLRWFLYVSGVAAAAAGVLGVFVLQGHRGARIGLSVAAVAIVITSVAGSLTSFLGMLIAVATAMLWTRPARDWFAGRPVTARPQPRSVEDREPPAPPAAPPVAWAPPTAGSAQPPATPGWGQASPAPPVPAAQPSWPAPVGQPVAPALPPPVPALPPPVPARPRTVRLACILTWVFSGVTALGYAGVLVVIAVDRDRLIEEVRKSPAWNDSFDVDTLTTFAAVASAVVIVWSLLAAALAVLVWRRVRWAWLVLLVSAWAAGLVSVLAFPFSLPYLAAIGASAGMLMRRQTRDWFAGPAAPRPPAPRPPVW